MFGYGPGGWWENITHVLWGIGSFFVGAFFFLVWLAVIVLFVRFLLIGTRAAKTYLRNNGVHDGVLPQRPATPAAAPATTVSPAAPATKPAPRPRTPKP